ncbi:hypothetical protein [Microseira wollei]|uniref:Band 7 domain-containing protein n=1 Tax=Microseira wollei NIES-4236 TaxID=2530354 RepID=A0AAV3XGQ5_9CYAN|nr:hypothetical protein [Microseira wollei]GET41075.1 hypothetical protein MiSe_58870 [Microseira wollei NIES-4236]
MSQANSLGKVIQEIDTKTRDQKAKSLSYDEKIVIIDKKKWKVIPKKPLLGGDIAFYLVCNTNDPANIAERQASPYYLTYFVTGEKLGIAITYWASCAAGNEEKVIESLCRGKTVGEALDKKIEKWIADFTKNDAAGFLDNYDVQLAKLREYVKIKVKEDVGINIELKLAFEKEAKLESFPIPSFPMEVNVSDCDDTLELQIQTELIVDPKNKVKAIFNDVKDARKWPELVRLFKREVKSYLLQYITIDQFSYELKDTVRDQLVTHLDSVLVNYGRKVGYLSLSSNAVASARQLVPIKCNVECEVQKYSEPIYVETTILMLPLNTARYKPNEGLKLEEWVESELEKIIKPLMLKKKYIDVLCNFEDVAEEIKKQMQYEAKSIGYAVNQIVSIPYLEHLELKENFDIEVTEKHLATNDANVKVILSVSATAKIADFTKIQDYLKPKADIKKLVEDTIYRTTSQLLNNISPERYYMRFYHPGVDEKGRQETASVEAELISAIKQELKAGFTADVSRITIHVHDTEIAKHFKKLYGKIGSFEVHVSSLADIEEAVTFRGDFQIEGVETNSWYTFQARQPEIEDISQSIERRLNSRLSTFTKDDLQYTNLEYLSLIENLINQWATDSVVEQFGLKIRISNLQRTRTQQELLLAGEKQKVLDVQRQARLKQLEAQSQIHSTTYEFKLRELNKLLARRENLLGHEDDEDEIEALDQRIRTLTEELKIPSLEDAATKVIKPQISQAPSLRELAEKAKLQESKNNPVLDDAPNQDLPELEGNDNQ